jgi:hypothetical protein
VVVAVHEDGFGDCQANELRDVG